MALPCRQETIDTTPKRIDKGIYGASISFTPRGTVLQGGFEGFSTSDPTECRQIAANTPVGFSQLTNDEEIWLATSTGSVIVDITDRNVDLSS